MFPFSSISILSAAGTLGSPGIVNIFPVIITINSAPAFKITSCTCILNGSKHSKFLGSSEKEYCVLAMQTGNLSYPFSFMNFIFACASSVISIPMAKIDF